jgi:hypothetical protein
MTSPTQSSSSPGPSPLVQAHPFDQPLHYYLSRAIEGHAQITAAIASHLAKDDDERQAVAATRSPG